MKPIRYEEPTGIHDLNPAFTSTQAIAKQPRKSVKNAPSPTSTLKVPRILVLGFFEWHVSTLASAIHADASSSPSTP
ncbi:hypothetical protein VNI00_003762 [Paramarasmius palmivorus]|uniref:Uncharacterized protein n=1 Tax=Paramarasmius palmivorus TaxID=297713 RepID=A0AAW0DVH1_9AGAR